jgi:outer membrane lipoprotein
MKKHLQRASLAIALLFIIACSVMPAAVKDQAADVPFPELVQNAPNYVGSTVILGGYVVEVTNEKDLTRIVAVQAPLGMGHEPKSKDRSQGRLIVEHKGFLVAEVYTKDRKITVAGKLLGSSATEQSSNTFPYVRLELSDIHLWAQEKQMPYDPYWDYRYYHFYPYPWGWRYPYGW